MEWYVFDERKENIFLLNYIYRAINEVFGVTLEQLREKRNLTFVKQEIHTYVGIFILIASKERIQRELIAEYLNRKGCTISLINKTYIGYLETNKDIKDKYQKVHKAFKKLALNR